MRNRGARGFTVLELMVVVAIIGIISTIAIVTFMSFKQRARQSEAKANLKSIFTTEESYAAEHETYSSYFSEIGFEPERGNRYAYYLGSGKVEDRAGAQIAVPADGFVNVITADSYRFSGLSEPAFAGTPVGPVGGDKTGFTATAAANIDSDPGVDSWEISTLSSQVTPACANDSNLAAGTPFVNYDDVACQ